LNNSGDDCPQNAKGQEAGPEATLFCGESLTPAQAADVAPRSLAHLGDAVFHLFEREREIRLSASAKQMHVRARVSASVQANLLDSITAELSAEELEIVRRARNVRATVSRRSEQATYRRATAFEALLGYLYLSDMKRLRYLLDLTLAPPGNKVANAAQAADNNP
jgi:ribonuclease-3 family protein